MHAELKAATRVLAFLLGIFGAICLGAAGMSVLNVIVGFYDDSPANYLVIAAVTLILAVISGFLCLSLFSWAAEDPGD
ncbi:MAG: hypothetical protein IPK93_04755 [Solirubrobacterales bacterium]|nr:hypothetical protein [Solirubrobacterales bacterium]